MVAKVEVKSEVTGSVWKMLAAVGQSVEAGETIMIIESMKMEIPVICEDGGRLVEIKVTEATPVSEGQVLAVLES